MYYIYFLFINKSSFDLNDGLQVAAEGGAHGVHMQHFIHNFFLIYNFDMKKPLIKIKYIIIRENLQPK